MNILIVSQHFHPEVFRINEIARELSAQGNHVEVVTGMPNYPKGEIFEGYEDKYEECYFGVKIHRTKIRPRHQGRLNLFRNYMSFMQRAKKTVKALDGSFDIVFCYMSSPIFQLAPAIYAKKRFKCPLVLMCCDQWPESLKAGGLNGGIVFDLIGLYCKRALNQCDHIINVAPSFIQYNHTKNGVPLEKMSWCIQHSEDNFKDVDTEKKDGFETVDMMFAGNIGKVQNAEDIIRAYNELKYDDLRIHIFGDGSSYEECRKLVQQYGLSRNVLLYGRVTPEELASYYSKMDACLLTLSGKSAIGNTIPAKLPGYLSAGKTVLAAIKGDVRDVIDEAQCGIYTDPDDYHKLAKLIDEFYRNKSRYSTAGKNGRLYYEKNCTLEVFISKLLKTFNMVCCSREN